MFCIVSPHETEAEPNLVALPRGIVVSVVSHQMMVMMVTMLIMMMTITMMMVMLMVMMVGSRDARPAPGKNGCPGPPRPRKISTLPRPAPPHPEKR